MINFKIFYSNLCAFLRLHNYEILSTESRSSNCIDYPTPESWVIETNPNPNPNPKWVHIEKILYVKTPENLEIVLCTTCDCILENERFMLYEPDSFTGLIFFKKDLEFTPGLLKLCKYLEKKKFTTIPQ